jgi:hypothetical protein
VNLTSLLMTCRTHLPLTSILFFLLSVLCSMFHSPLIISVILLILLSHLLTCLFIVLLLYLLKLNHTSKISNVSRAWENVTHENILCIVNAAIKASLHRLESQLSQH